MKIKNITYTECLETPQEWKLNRFSFWDKNLLVGKNATGKTRTLNIVGNLARNLAGLQALGSKGEYIVEFEDSGIPYVYELKTEVQKVSFEKITVNGIVRLERGNDGSGRIFYEKIDDGKMIDFQSPPDKLASVARRDNIQHKFLEPLFAWGEALRHYHFGGPLGKENLAIFHPGGAECNERDENAVVPLFRKGVQEFSEQFLQALISDMEKVDYKIESITIGAPKSIKISGVPGEAVGLWVKERDLPGITDQFSMSQGMFRTLSLLIHINYCQLKYGSACFLIDDIGEGLDFDRSCRLIKLIREKATKDHLVIVMTTNDRFIMNEVPLDEWSVLVRKGNQISVFNKENSKDKFEEFKYTGLSNFSFFEMDVFEETATEE